MNNLKFFSLIFSLLLICFIIPDSLFGQLSLTGGEQTFPLPSTGTGASPTFKNNSLQPICDLLLSTKKSIAGADPKFTETIPVVRKPSGGTNLNWVVASDPDGKTDAKILAPGIPDNDEKCIQIGETFSISLNFNSLGVKDSLTITPTNIDKVQIVSLNDHSSTEKYCFFNGHDGLDGATTASFIGINATGFPVKFITLSVLYTGIDVVEVSSTLPVNPSNSVNVLELVTPILPGGAFDYEFTISGLIPFSPSDPNPVTCVEMQLSELVAITSIPTLSEWGLIILALLGLSIGMAFIRRRESALAISGAGQINNKASVFDKRLYGKSLAIIMLIFAVGITLSGLWYSYVTATDFIGTLISSFIVAYIVHLWILQKKA